jgi:hypothetical protein
VIDASLFPIIPDATIQNAVYMVAKKVREQRTHKGFLEALTLTSSRELT